MRITIHYDEANGRWVSTLVYEDGTVIKAYFASQERAAQYELTGSGCC